MNPSNTGKELRAVKPAPKLLTLEGLKIHGYIDEDTQKAIKALIQSDYVERKKTATNKELEKLIGKRCDTKDLQDFPDLKDDERCLSCNVWELIDTLYIEKAKVVEAVEKCSQMGRIEDDGRRRTYVPLDEILTKLNLDRSKNDD